jgi:hypothetical protein
MVRLSEGYGGQCKQRWIIINKKYELAVPG